MVNKKLNKTIQCKVCNCPFERGKGRIYCGASCRSKAFYLRHRDKISKRDKAERLKNRTKKSTLIKVKHCIVCKKEFKPDLAARFTRKYCSRACRNRNYKKNNKDKIKRYNQLKVSTPQGRLYHNIRVRIFKAFRNNGYSKNTKTWEILGCDYDHLCQHLLNSFVKTYSRKPIDSDELHIDHIVPMDTAQTYDDIVKLNHYSNLQWLLKKDNLRKSNKLNWTVNQIIKE